MLRKVVQSISGILLGSLGLLFAISMGLISLAFTLWLLGHVLAFLGVCLFFLGACTMGQGEPPPVALTAAEYAEEACDPTEWQNETWGRFRESANREIAHIEPVRPPAEVREWHFAYLAFLKATIAAMEARGLDIGAPMNANEIITDSQLNSTFDAWLEALASMTPEVRGVLEEAGCIRTDL